jgi:hypothetical protein
MEVSMLARSRLIAGLIATWCLGCAGPQPRPATDGGQSPVTKTPPHNERRPKPEPTPVADMTTSFISGIAAPSAQFATSRAT